MNIGLATEAYANNSVGHGQIFHMEQANGPDLLQIAQKLHASLDPGTVFSSFARTLGQILPLVGINMHLQGQRFQWGQQGSLHLNRSTSWEKDNVKFAYHLQAPLGASQISLLSKLEHLLMQPLRNAWQYQNMSRQAMLDSLTGLGNRRDFERSVSTATAKARRTLQPLSLLILDLDKFKQLNDNWGHPLGDQVLKAFGELLSNGVRSGDQAFRLGGDEFVILLDGDLAGCRVLCNRLLNRLRENNLLSQYQVQISIGGASYHGSMTPEQFFKQADDALYQAKNGGRNGYALAE
ncbi:diguanylate cyclase [Shewanella sp. NFH-SH190041]|uniref:GGDEF domain-containing protein n=1 Tax=Shewanella sp. NFH-SH190041 TaxID=2950245 RepID=UPI0021C47E57|nr:GGDEF domain-containing protein [Shewanella sp. NFH-SH190041]BDM65304.1 diguanylate cyclase [Shewanella sp. NFH-SH190041]